MADPTLPFTPLDDDARNGRGQLVRDTNGRMHAAAFVNGRWSYSGDPHQPVRGEIVEYYRRRA